MNKPLLPLDNALRQAQKLHVIIQPTPRSINLWSSNRVPQQLRDTIKANRVEVRKLLQEGDVRTCPNPDLHRKEWKHNGNQSYICEICQRLKFQ